MAISAAKIFGVRLVGQFGFAMTALDPA